MALLRPTLALLLFIAVARPARARENPYDVVGKVLAPFTQVIAASTKTRNRAFTVQLRVEEANRSDPQFLNQPVTFAVEMPDRLRVSAPLAGERITLCRAGQKIWAYPGSRLQALLDDPKVAKALPEKDRKFKLAPFELPIPEQQLAFLPILFQVQEVGDEKVGELKCRVLDVQLQKDLNKTLEVKKASARIWVSDDYQLVRIVAHSSEGDAALRIDETKFAKALPAESWQPTAEESGDVLEITPPVYDQLVRAFIGKGR